MPGIHRPHWLGGGEKKEQPVKVELTDLEKLCRNPKYFQDFGGEENLADLQKRLAYELSCLDFEGVLNSKCSMETLLKEAEETKKTALEYTEKAKVEHDRATKLEKKLKIDSSVLNDLNNVRKAEQEYSETAKKERDKAAELYRKLGTLALLRKEIRVKIDPNASAIDPKIAKTYLQEAADLGYQISYGAVMLYPKIASDVVSDHLASYQIKVPEKKPATTVGSLKK